MLKRIISSLFLFIVLPNALLFAQTQPSNLPPLVFPDGVGVNIHFVNGASMWSNRSNIEDPSYGPINRYMLDMIAAAGFKFIRMDMYWQDIETTKGVYNWAPYDTLVSELDQRGIRALFILDYNDTLYANSTFSAVVDSADIAAYSDFAAAAVKHFAGHHFVWEIWNEPNNTINWEPSHNAVQYAAMVASASKAMRNADPTATIVAPAMAGIQLNVLDTLFQAGILNYVNGVSLHPYRDNPPPPRIPETVGPDFANVRALISKYEPAGDTIPIVSSEWGYSTCSPSLGGVSRQTQADYFARMQLFNLYSGAPLSIWYDWMNDGLIDKIGRHRGVVDYYLNPKPAYITVTVLTRELPGYRVVERYNDGNTSDVILVMENAGDTVKVAAWTTGAAHQLNFPLTSLSLPDTAKTIYWVNTNSDSGTIPVSSGGFTDGLSGTPKIYSVSHQLSGVPVATVPTPVSPDTSASKVAEEALFTWSPSTSYFQITYRVQVASDSLENGDGTFQTQYVVVDTVVADTSLQLTRPLNPNTKYYWHVSAINPGGSSSFTPTRSFVTGAAVTFPATPSTISPGSLTTGVTLNTDFSWHPSQYAQNYQLQIADNYQVYTSGDSVGTFLPQNVLFDTVVTDTSVRLAVNLDSNTTYFWHVRAANDLGPSQYSTTSKFSTGTELTSVEGLTGGPRAFALSQNYPNPFNPTTMISYSVPKRAMVHIEVYDALGRRVATLVDSEKSPGKYSVEFNGSELASGVYFITMRAGAYMNTRKVMMIK